MLEGCQPELQRPQRCTEQSCCQGGNPAQPFLFSTPTLEFPSTKFSGHLLDASGHKSQCQFPVESEVTEMTDSVSALRSLYFRVCDDTNKSQSNFLFRVLQGLHIINGVPGLQGSGMSHFTWNCSSGFSVLSQVDTDNKLIPFEERFQKCQKFESFHQYNSVINQALRSLRIPSSPCLSKGATISLKFGTPCQIQNSHSQTFQC